MKEFRLFETVPRCWRIEIFDRKNITPRIWGLDIDCSGREFSTISLRLPSKAMIEKTEGTKQILYSPCTPTSLDLFIKDIKTKRELHVNLRLSDLEYRILYDLLKTIKRESKSLWSKDE